MFLQMNYFLFIGESLGWQEIIVIGIIALIVLGPRKLPQLAKTIGKTMAEFRKVTHEFKSTWEKEVEEDKSLLKDFAADMNEDAPSTVRTIEPTPENLLKPEVKELTPEQIEAMFPRKELVKESVAAESAPVEVAEEVVTQGKRDWI
jgi:sec-independent protein translocase protein TatB